MTNRLRRSVPPQIRAAAALRRAESPRRSLLALISAFVLALALALALGADASAQVTGPLPNPPQPGANQTSNLIFDAMMAVARAAATNPQAAQSASLSYTQAVNSYNAGDVNRARTAAIQALMSANQPQHPTAIATIQPFTPTTAYQTNPFPIAGGSVAQVDADAFVAQARGAVQACVAAHAPSTQLAQQRLAAAEREDKAGRYQDVRVDAKAAVDLCAAARAGSR
ncbi:MAG: hypothetical protein QOI11_1360 [Candidatus Eremiobacteraeota bacterium]|nr:hypothetical protein [Candidatus Eremiobacteraeota bacterium]